MMGLLQARLGSPDHPVVSAWPLDPPCPQLKPPCISPCLSRPPPSLQDTALAAVHCPSSVGTTEMGPSVLSPYPSEPDPLGPSPVSEPSPPAPSLMRHNLQSRSDTFH